jgi:membrane protein
MCAFPGGVPPSRCVTVSGRPVGLTASSLTFPTSIAGAFYRGAGGVHAFPMLRDIPGALQGWLVRSLIPDNIARQVGYLIQ